MHGHDILKAMHNIKFQFSVMYPDVQQHLLGSCSLDDIAVCVATRVVGHYPRRGQVSYYGTGRALPAE